MSYLSVAPPTNRKLCAVTNSLDWKQRNLAWQKVHLPEKPSLKRFFYGLFSRWISKINPTGLKKVHMDVRVMWTNLFLIKKSKQIFFREGKFNLLCFPSCNPLKKYNQTTFNLKYWLKQPILWHTLWTRSVDHVVKLKVHNAKKRKKTNKKTPEPLENLSVGTFHCQNKTLSHTRRRRDTLIRLQTLHHPLHFTRSH